MSNEELKELLISKKKKFKVREVGENYTPAEDAWDAYAEGENYGKKIGYNQALEEIIQALDSK